MVYDDYKSDVDSLLANFVELAKRVNVGMYPSDVYEECYATFYTWLNKRTDLHIQVPQEETEKTQIVWFSQYLYNSYILPVATAFYQVGAPFAAIEFLIHAWNSLALRQIETGYRIYRASVALSLAKLAYMQGDIGAATWWALHTQGDDHMGGSKEGGGGRQMLKTVLGVSKLTLNTFSSIGTENFQLVSTHQNWSIASSLAEDVVVRFALEKRALSYVLGSNSTTVEYPISPAYFQTLLNDIGILDNESESQKTNQDKGEALEKLAAYLLLLIPGWLPLRNMQDEKQTAEIDLVVRNVYPNGNLMADIFGRYFIVECKNWKKPVGARDVGYFLNKIRLSHATFGIIFSHEGITGEGEEERAAKELTRRAFHEDKSVCIVISRKDLESLKKGDTTFRSLLLELFEEFRFGRPKHLG